MKLKLKTTGQILVIATALLSVFSTLISQTANAARMRSLLYDRAAAPYWRNHLPPYEVRNSDYGIYRKIVLPDGTVTGPIAPDANGG